MGAHVTESLLAYSLKLTDQLSMFRPGALRDATKTVLQQLAQRAGFQHACLLTVHSGFSRDASLALFAEWSDSGRPQIRESFPRVHLEFLGKQAVESLRSGSMVFTRLSANENACSKLISGLLGELELNCLELVPILLDRQLRAVICLARDGVTPLMDGEKGVLIQLIGRITYSAVRNAVQNNRQRREHQQWKRVANGACDFAFRVNPQLEISATISFRQKNPPAVRGLPLREFVSPQSWDKLSETIAEARKSSSPRSLEIRAATTRGVGSFVVRVEPGRSETGALTIYLTSNDVERALTEELRGLRDQLDRAARLSLLGHLATEFAHQLTQPLQAISAKCYTLRARISRKEPKRRYLELAEAIDENVLHARDIINSLRDFVRDRRMKLTPVCLRQMVQHAIKMVAVPAEKETIRIRTSDPQNIMPDPDSMQIYVDRVHTTHVLLNLLVNAMEACSAARIPEPEVTVTVRRDEGDRKILVEVSDNGPGIPPAKLDHVFDRFFTTKTDGFGIGLAICRDVIERQGGTIGVRNNPGGGCTFTFSVPMWSGQDEDDDDSEGD